MPSKNSTKRGAIFLHYLFPAIILAGFFIFTNKAIADDINIDQDTTWHDGEIINIANGWGDLNINPGVKLTIEAGAIIKLESYSNINVYGDLEIQGTTTKPVIITSIKDDSVGGDTNNDGNATIPAPGSWGKIKTLGSAAQINIDYAQIKYGGAQQVFPCFAGSPLKIASTGNTITISHSNIIDNQELFTLGNSDFLKINYSNIYNNYNPDYCYQYDNGIDCGAQIENNGDNIYDLKNNYWGNPFGPTQILTDDDWNKPILGTLIIGQADYLPFLTSPWTPAPPKPKLNPVILIPGFFGSWSATDNGRLELDPILHTYDNLWSALKLAGYEQDKSLFAFPYNWRQSNATTSLLLKQKIDEVKSACNSANLVDYDCDKVDLIGHSMGGLVARTYIEGDKYANDVDQLIFLATPQQGAPMAYLSWEGGDAGLGFEKSIMEKIILVEADKNGYPSNFSYIRNLPMTSVQELLPTFDYLRDKGSDDLRTYFFDGYPRNIFLENLNNQYNLDRLQAVKILNIVADAGVNKTINVFRVVPGNYLDGRWENGYPEDYGRLFTDHGIEYGAGDDTVPAISNKDFNGFEQIIISTSSHVNIVTDAQKSVIKELTGIRPEQEVRLSFFEKFFMVRIFSPVDFVIIAPDGKKLGKDFLTGQNINEIDGAFYSGKFATIPNPLDGEYKVELQGTGSGEYKLSVSGIDDATSTDKDFIGQITTGAKQDFKINYSSSSPDLLADLQPQDTVSPNLVINFPLEGSSYKHSDKMIINYNAIDDFSGITSIEMKIDDKLISSTTVNLFDYQLGTHTLAIIAQDKAGNYAEKKVNFKINTDIKSAIADIEIIYKNGWLKNLCRKNILIGELKILDSALGLFDKEKSEIIKKIAETKKNPKLSAKAKEKLIAALNKKLIELDKNRQEIIKLNLAIFEKTLNETKKSNYLNQAGYGIIKNNLEYLKINL
jgi:pimeloyl-ACP methyl ester carboxylesterase